MSFKDKQKPQMPQIFDDKGQVIPEQQNQGHTDHIVEKKGKRGSRKGLTVGLGSKYEPNDLQHYMSLNIQPLQLKCQIPKQVFDSILQEEKYKKIAQIDERPEDFFNFGLDREAFQTFMMLMIIRRAQRENLCKKLEAVHSQLKNSILKKEFLSSDEPKIHFHPQVRKHHEFG